MTTTQSAFLPLDLHHFHSTVTGSLRVVNHFDLLNWLQGDMQHYLPHDMLIAAWGDFDGGAVQHDVITAIPGVRSLSSDAAEINALLVKLFAHWKSLGKRPHCLNSMDDDFWLHEYNAQSTVGSALRKMRSVLVHGVVDQRGAHDCLFVTFSTSPTAADASRMAMPMVLPYIEMALRHVAPLPHQLQGANGADGEALAQFVQEKGITERELEVLRWVTLGKTNPEIGAILDLSEFTVKNHLKRIFRKLDVMNRAQAVGKFQSWISHV